MGGRTAGEDRDTILKPLAKAYPDVVIDVVWYRETFGFEQVTAHDEGITLTPQRGDIPRGSPLADRLRSQHVFISLVLGDDMNIVLEREPASREPIQIFNKRGEIVRTVFPGEGSERVT